MEYYNNAFCAVSPDPVGIGQTLSVNLWINMPTPTATGAYGDEYKNMTIVVTDPNGVKTTLGPFTSDDTGGTHTTYTPTVAGNYTFVMVYPGQTLTGIPVSTSRIFGYNRGIYWRLHGTIR